MNIYHCGHCDHQGPKVSNGYAAGWCGGCGLNNQLTKVAKSSDIGITVNGNIHLANMEVQEYSGLKFVTESPQDGAVRLTIYRGDDPTPISKETYGNESSIPITTEPVDAAE